MYRAMKPPAGRLAAERGDRGLAGTAPIAVMVTVAVVVLFSAVATLLLFNALGISMNAINMARQADLVAKEVLRIYNYPVDEHGRIADRVMEAVYGRVPRYTIISIYGDWDGVSRIVRVTFFDKGWNVVYDNETDIKVGARSYVHLRPSTIDPSLAVYDDWKTYSSTIQYVQFHTAIGNDFIAVPSSLEIPGGVFNAPGQPGEGLPGVGSTLEGGGLVPFMVVSWEYSGEGHTAGGVPEGRIRTYVYYDLEAEKWLGYDITKSGTLREGEFISAYKGGDVGVSEEINRATKELFKHKQFHSHFEVVIKPGEGSQLLIVAKTYGGEVVIGQTDMTIDLQDIAKAVSDYVFSVGQQSQSSTGSSGVGGSGEIIGAQYVCDNQYGYTICGRR